jgi:phosphatidylinositol glycan class F
VTVDFFTERTRMFSFTLSSLDRAADLVAVLAWCLLPVGGPSLSSHVSAGLFALILLHGAARVALALVLGFARSPFVTGAAAVRSLMVGTLAWLSLLLLFGAPVASSQVDSLLFAVLLACWTVLPSALAFNVSYDQWLAFFVRHERLRDDAAAASGAADADAVSRSLVRRAYATAIGCWAGALVIPLDWDRPWQVWPVPCVFGAALGHALGSLAC